MPTPELNKFLGVLRAGDRQEVEELLGDLDPFLRRIIRLRLIDGRLRHVLDTADIFQSLLKDFLSQEHPPVETSAGLRAYLAAAVHHKIHTKARKERRHAGSLPEACEPVSPEPPAGRHVEDHDFSQAIRARLSGEKRLLFDLKLQGLTWTDIAAKRGGTPDAARMLLGRAIATVLSELGHKELSYAH
jgi:DNA-directed RNA polymerase specialized sigma24 family protein